MLEELVGRDTTPTPEVLGFMLRHVFVLTRRHLAWPAFVLDDLLPDA